MRTILRKALRPFLVILTLAASIIPVAAIAQSWSVTSGGGGGVSSALVCLLSGGAGCTMTGQAIYSGVTDDIVSVANQDLRLRGQGTGSVQIQSGDGGVDFLDSGGVTRLIVAPAAVFTGMTWGAGMIFQGNNRSAAQLTWGIGDDSMNLVGYGTGFLRIPATGTQTAACAANALTLDPTSSRVELTQSGAANCVVTMSETTVAALDNAGAVGGAWTTICATAVTGGATSINFADQAGILNIAGGAISLTAESCIDLMYLSTGIFVEKSRSLN